MTAQEVLCESCSYIISNPICEHCYMKQVIYWLAENRVDKAGRGKIVRAIKISFAADPAIGVLCVICNNQTYRRCGYCFFLKVAKILNRERVSRGQIESFLSTFNYRHFREEYAVFPDQIPDQNTDFSRFSMP